MLHQLNHLILYLYIVTQQRSALQGMVFVCFGTLLGKVLLLVLKHLERENATFIVNSAEYKENLLVRQLDAPKYEWTRC